MYKVILDRNILHGGLFLKLKQSVLQDCVKQKKIIVYFTTAFWEETLRIADRDAARLQEELSFLFSIDSKNWFSHIEDIIEVVRNSRNAAGFV